MNLLMLLNAASAQEETFDAHGLIPVSEDGDLRDGLATWRAESQDGKRGTASLLIEYADENLVEYIDDLDGITETPLLDNMLAGNVRGGLYFGKRLGLGLTLPVVVSSEGATGAGGFGLADARLALPVGLILPGEDGTGFGLSVVPFADLPIGDDERFLGDASLGGGGILAASVGASRFQLNLNAGVDISPETSVLSWTGGTGLIGGAGVNILFSETLALSLEGQARPLLEESLIDGTHFPAEAVAALRGRYVSGLHWTLGGAVPLSEGATAPQFRTYAGIGWAFGAAPPATLSVFVTDNDGAGVPGATVDAGTGALTTGADGSVLVDDLRAGQDVGVQASKSGYETNTASVELETGENEVRMSITALPASINLSVTGPDRSPLNATVTLTGPNAPAGGAIGDDGAELYDGLKHGDWSLSLTAPGYQDTTRGLSLSPGEEAPLEVVMRPGETAPEQPTEQPTTVVSMDLPVLYFDTNEFNLTRASKAKLRKLADQLRSDPSLKLVIYGYADVRGGTEFNEGLGQLRANETLDYLAELGIDYKRLSAKTYGESRQVDNEAYDANRRVTFEARR